MKTVHGCIRWDLPSNVAADIDQALTEGLDTRPTAEVTLFKASGKYYTQEHWVIPKGAIGPYDMDRSPSWRRIDGGAVLVTGGEPFGYPHLFPSVSGG